MRTTCLRQHVRLGIATLVLGAWPAFCDTSITAVLGQPTDRSITLNARANAAFEMYLESGVKSGTYTAQTKATTGAADPYQSGYFVFQVVMDGLQPDTQYYYRMQTRVAGSTAGFTAGKECSFHTQRLPGSTFTFCVQGDSHPERAKVMFDPNLYIQTLNAVAAASPDFFITSGDDFSVDTLQTPYTQPAVTGRYTLQLPYLDTLGHSVPVFLGTGNHEETSLSNYNLPPDSANSNQVPIWAQNARNLYFASPGPNDPITGKFYTGNTTNVPKIGPLRDYYAWEWGDALFAVIDPYWTSPAQVDTGLGGQNSTTSKTSDRWGITHGDAQYQWLKQTLEQSKAKWKFVFAHHVMGTGRGGIAIADQYEWGGKNGNGSWGFTTNRPQWAMPLHQLMAANHVTIFFQGHDHLFSREQLDGVVYQSLPNPADNTYTAFNADAYPTGNVFPNSGFVRVTVSPSGVKVDYIREFLQADEKPPSQVSGMVQFSYVVSPGGAAAPPPAIASVNPAGGNGAIAPNSWVEIKGSNLALAGSSRTWQGADFVNSQLPKALDGVSVTVNGKSAYVYYVSSTQVNVLTPPDAMSGPVTVQVTAAGVAGQPFTVQAQAAAPALLTFGGTPYVAATHADGNYLGPATLYPGATTAAKPGETVVLYGNGFGATTVPVVAGSLVQSGLLATLPAVQIGGAQAAVQFAGLVSPGLFQFNVVVPPGTADGDQPIRVTYNGLSTQAATLLTVQR
jgi:uncharacterized protein (TIGR03437 family)